MTVNPHRTMITLDQLRVFVAVAERQHLTRGATALSMTPSAISASIKALEERHGTALFDRVGRGIVLSDAGRHFLPQAQATLASARATELTLAELGNGRRGHLHLQASQTIASYWLPPLLVEFHRQFPQVEIRVEVGNTRSVARAVADGAIEIGFVEDRIEPGELAIKPVAEDRFAVVVAPGHPWADGRPVALEELRQAKWIMREQGSGTRSAFELMLGGAGIGPTGKDDAGASDAGLADAATGESYSGQAGPETVTVRADGARTAFDRCGLDIAFLLPSNESVRSAVIAGPYVSVMSTLAVASEIAAGLLCRVNVDLPSRAFYLLRHATRYRSRVCCALEELIEARRGAGAQTAPKPATAHATTQYPASTSVRKTRSSGSSSKASPKSS